MHQCKDCGFIFDGHLGLILPLCPSCLSEKVVVLSEDDYKNESEER